MRRRGRATVAATVGVPLVGAFAVAVLSAPHAVASEAYALPPNGTVTVLGHGNGHGHGMSQYGAYGAALAGLSATQIVSFYYPGTSLTTLPASTIRVLLSGGLSMTTVAASSTLQVSGHSGALPSSGISQYRLAPSGSGFVAQGLIGGTWTNEATGLGAQADFSDPGTNYVRLIRADGTRTDYHGSVGGLRNGGGQLTINRLPLDTYVIGVVPREMPASWSASAVQAQAIAARSYARNSVESSTGNAYDICDTDQCQVYGGARHLDSAGNVLWTDDPAAITGNANMVLRYGGSTIFAQFSASDGGWTVAGGQPYLVAKQDPYDDAASGDPYLNWTRTPSVASIASYYGLRTATSIEITARDGNGQWGGRVLSGYVNGVSTAGAAEHIATTGFALQDAMGLPHNWFTFDLATPRVPTAGATTISPTSSSVMMLFRDGSGNLQERNYVGGQGWQPPADLGAPASGLSWDPDAASWGSGHVDVAARDASGHFVVRSYSPSSGWSGWTVFPGVVMNSSPGAVSPVPNSLYIFYLGANNTLWTTRWLSGHGWSGPSPVPGVTNAVSGPDAMASTETNKTMTVDYRGSDGRLWMVTSKPTGGWGAPGVVNPTHPLPAPLASVDPSIGDTGTGGPSVYYTGSDGGIYHSSYNPSSNTWSPWYAVAGAAGVTSAPDISNEGTKHLDLIAGFNGVLRTTSWNAGVGWRAWATLN